MINLLTRTEIFNGNEQGGEQKYLPTWNDGSYLQKQPVLKKRLPYNEPKKIGKRLLPQQALPWNHLLDRITLNGASNHDELFLC